MSEKRNDSSTAKHTKETSRQIWKCLTSILLRQNDNWPYWNDRIDVWSIKHYAHTQMYFCKFVSVLHWNKWHVCKCCSDRCVCVKCIGVTSVRHSVIVGCHKETINKNWVCSSKTKKKHNKIHYGPCNT